MLYYYSQLITNSWQIIFHSFSYHQPLVYFLTTALYASDSYVSRNIAFISNSFNLFLIVNRIILAELLKPQDMTLNKNLHYTFPGPSAVFLGLHFAVWSLIFSWNLKLKQLVVKLKLHLVYINKKSATLQFPFKKVNASLQPQNLILPKCFTKWRPSWHNYKHTMKRTVNFITLQEGWRTRRPSTACR